MPKPPSDVLQYIEDAKEADFYGALEYVAENPRACKMLNTLFNETMAIGLDYDILVDSMIIPAEKQKERTKQLEQLHKTLDNLIAFKVARKIPDKPRFAITTTGHDTCVTYANLLALAKESEGVETNEDAIKQVREFLKAAA